MPEAPTYKDANAVRDAYRKGSLTRDQAKKIIDESEFVIPGDPMTDPDAYERQMRETVKREDAQRAKEEAEGPGFWDRIANALYRGYQGYQQTEIDQYGDPDKSDFADIATSAAIQENLPMGKGLQEFYQSKGFGESVKNLFAHDYGGTLLELVAESMGSYIPSVVERAPARVAAGAAIGAGVGATALGAGAAPGALTGASWGFTASFGDAALALEYSNIILSGLKEQGVDVTNAKALEDGFSDPKVMGNLRTKAIKGGIPVALFDMFTARLGGRFLAGAKKKGTSKAVAGAKEFVTQGAGGAAGEISKSLVLGEEISAPGVVGEIFGEGPTSVLEIGVGYMEKTKGIDVPQPKLPDNMEGNWRTVDSFEVEESVDAETSLDEVLDQVEKPLPDVQQKEAEVNQAQAESQKEKEIDEQWDTEQPHTAPDHAQKVDKLIDQQPKKLDLLAEKEKLGKREADLDENKDKEDVQAFIDEQVGVEVIDGKEYFYHQITDDVRYYLLSDGKWYALHIDEGGKPGDSSGMFPPLDNISQWLDINFWKFKDRYINDEELRNPNAFKAVDRFLFGTPEGKAAALEGAPVESEKTADPELLDLLEGRGTPVSETSIPVEPIPSGFLAGLNEKSSESDWNTGQSYVEQIIGRDFESRQDFKNWLKSHEDILSQIRKSSKASPASKQPSAETKQEEAKQEDAAPTKPEQKVEDRAPVVPDPTPEQQEQAAKEDVQRATERAAEQPDVDSMPQNQDTFNALHKYARLAKKQGKTLQQWASENGLEMSDAVVAAWDDADNETPTTLDMLPPEVNAALGNNNLRNRAAKFANADISDEVLGGVSNVGYEKRSNETDAEYAQRDIEEKGLDAATTTALDTGDNMPAPAKTVYQAEVLQALRNDEKDAQATGDQAREDQRIDQQIALMERINEASTNAGQFLQAFSHFSRLSVGGMLKYAKRAFEKIAGKKVKDAQDAFRRVRDTLRDTEEQVVNEVIKETQDKLIGSDPKVKDATRKQVGELVAKEEKPETSEIVRKHYEKPDDTPLPQKLERSGMDSKTAAREGRRIEAKYKRVHAKVTGEVKKRMKQILKKMPLWKRYKNEVVAALTRAVNPATKKNASAPLQKFSQRLSNNLRKQMKSLRPERKGSIDKLTDEQVLAEGISNLEKYEQVWLETQQELREQDNLTPEQIAQLDQVFKDGTPMPFAASTMDRAIRSAMVRLEQNLDKVVRQNREGQNEARTKVIDDIIARTGLVGKEAELLSDMLNKRYNELATKRKKAALNKLNRTDGKVIPAAIKSKYQKIIEWSNLGAFSDSKFDEELAKRLDIPVMTDSIRKEVVRRARIIESMPEGFQRQREAIKLMNYIKGQQKFGLADLFWDFWFANVLSGLSTQTINLLGSTMNLMAHTITQFIRKPGDLGVMIKGLARGMRKGLSEGREVLQSGLITGTRLEKFEQARNLELIERFRGGKFNPLSYLKFVGRGLAAGDMLFFKTAEEMRAAVIARNVAKDKNLKGRALARATNEILNNTAAAREKATIQADKEGLKGLDRRRRIAELMEEGRPQPEEAKEYALRVIYSNKPYGVLGTIAELVNKLNAQIPLFRVFAPFVNIVSNVTNESLNYFPPVGYARSLQAKRKGELYGKPLSEDSNTRKDQMGDQFAKSTLGMVAMTAVGGLAWSMKDDEDPWFMVYGTGPRDYGKNKTWKATGALPYSIKINDTYIPYKDTVMAIPFAVIGSFLDGHRYNGAQDDELVSRLALSLTYTAGVITENSFLKGIQAAAAGINQKMSGDTATKVISQQASRTITGAVVPFGGLLRDIDRLNDPTRYDGIDIETMLYSQIPFVRRVNKPTLNVLGEPVEMHVSDRYWSTPRASEELRYLVERGAFPSFPNKNSTVNLFGRDMEPDEFYDYIKISGEQIRARIKSEVFANRRLFDRRPASDTKYVVDSIVREERAKAKAKLFTRYGR